MAALPPEILILILQAVAPEPIVPDTFDLTRGSLHALSLVNRQLHELTGPLLYAAPRVGSNAVRTLLVRTLESALMGRELARHVRRIKISGGGRQRTMGSLDPLIRLLVMCEEVAFVGMSEVEVVDLASLSQMPNLKRLSLVSSRCRISSSFLLPSLTELTLRAVHIDTTYGKLRPSCMPQLRHLSLRYLLLRDIGWEIVSVLPEFWGQLKTITIYVGDSDTVRSLRDEAEGVVEERPKLLWELEGDDLMLLSNHAGTLPRPLRHIRYYDSTTQTHSLMSDRSAFLAALSNNAPALRSLKTLYIPSEWSLDSPAPDTDQHFEQIKRGLVSICEDREIELVVESELNEAESLMMVCRSFLDANT
ncbi:hypothetical protein T439DRAFT_328820 [Meredithblackwellia eburnea MCA 4105]